MKGYIVTSHECFLTDDDAGAKAIVGAYEDESDALKCVNDELAYYNENDIFGEIHLYSIEKSKIIKEWSTEK